MPPSDDRTDIITVTKVLQGRFDGLKEDYQRLESHLADGFRDVRALLAEQKKDTDEKVGRIASKGGRNEDRITKLETDIAFIRGQSLGDAVKSVQKIADTNKSAIDNMQGQARGSGAWAGALVSIGVTVIAGIIMFILIGGK